MSDDYDDYRSDDDAPQTTSAARSQRAEFLFQALMANTDGEVAHACVQNDVFATVNDKMRLTVTTPEGQPYTRSYTTRVHALFLDPTGSHAFVSFVNGDLEYINIAERKHCKVAMSSSAGIAVLASVPILGGGASKAQDLPAAQFVTSAIGWDQTNTSRTSTGMILCGSREGSVYELRAEVQDGKAASAVNPLIKGGEQAFEEPISSVVVERFPRLGRIAVLIGSTRRLQRYWAELPRGAAPSVKPVLDTRAFETRHPSAGSDQNNGAISVYRPSLHGPPVGFAWNSSVGIFHGLFANSREAQEPTSLSHIPFGSASVESTGPFAVLPRDVTLMAYHMVLTYEEKCIVILAPAGLPWVSIKASPSTVDITAKRVLSSRDKALTSADFSDRLRAGFNFGRRGHGIGGIRDVAQRKTFVVTSGSLSEIEVSKEHKSAWRLFLQRAVDRNEEVTMRERCFVAAAKLTERFDRDKLSLVKYQQGIFYCERGKYSEATKHFAETDRFEQVFEYLALNTTRHTLIDFLEKRLVALESDCAMRGGAGAAARDASVLCLSVVTLMLWLQRRAAADSENDAIRNDVNTRMHNYLLSRTAHVSAVDMPQLYSVVERLIASHGRTDALIAFAEAMKRFRYTVSHYVNKQQFHKACDVLRKRCTNSEHANVWYEFAPILIHHIPCALFDGLIEVFDNCKKSGRRTFLKPELLLPALVSYDVKQNEDDTLDGIHRGIEYLKITLTQDTRAVIWNYLILLCIEQNELPHLNVLLKKRDAGYTQEFVLRKLLSSGDPKLHQLCVLLYERMGLIAEAVAIAVSVGFEGVQRAKTLVRDGAIDDSTKKKLWRIIAELVAEHEDHPQAVLDVVDESGSHLMLEDVLMILARKNTVLAEIKQAICKSLDGYSEKISRLRDAMEEATLTAQEIKGDEAKLLNQFGYITASQRCDLCSRPLLQNMGAAPFMMYPSCAHAFHEHCINDLYTSSDRDRLAEVGIELGLEQSELHSVAAIRDADCPICGEFAIAQIEDSYFDQYDAEAQIWDVI